MLKYAIIFLVGLLSALLLTPIVRSFALAFGAVDYPGEDRRVHQHPTPRLGGLAIYGALLVTAGLGLALHRFVTPVLFGPDFRFGALAFGATVALLTGVIDDVRSLSAREKLGLQILAALAVIFSGYRIQFIGGADIGFFSIPLSLLWILAVTNAFNLMDGLDGLAAGLGVIVCVTLFSVSVYAGQAGVALILAALAGALVGFLRYNFYPASIFLGDSGSLLLGFIFAVLAIDAPSRPSAVVAIVVPLLALGLPLVETALTVVRRLLRGVEVTRIEGEKSQYAFSSSADASVLGADRRHIHHRLLDMGLTQRTAVVILYVSCALLGAVAFVVTALREPNLGLLLVAFMVATFVGVRRLDYGEIRVLKNGVLLPLFEAPLVNRRLFHVLVDLVLILAAYLGALLISNAAVFDDAVRQRFIASGPILALVQIVIFVSSGLYRRSYRYTGIADLSALFRSLALASLGGFCVLQIGPDSASALNTAVLDGYLLSTLIGGVRFSFRLLEHAARGRAGGRNALLYGAGRGGIAALREIQENPALALRPIGFLDDDTNKTEALIGGCPVYGPEDFDLLIHRRAFDELVVVSQKIATARLRAVAERCALAGIKVRRLAFNWEDLEIAEPGAPSDELSG